MVFTVAKLRCEFQKVAMWNRVDWYSTVFLTRLCKTRSDSVRDVWGSNTNIRHVSFEGLCGYTGEKKIKIVLQGLFRLLEAHLFWPLPKKDCGHTLGFLWDSIQPLHSRTALMWPGRIHILHIVVFNFQLQLGVACLTSIPHWAADQPAEEKKIGWSARLGTHSLR